MKILLILVDGMRPDAISEMEEVKRFTNISSYTLHAETVFPSVTLPCHMSLFHSVSRDRHGITSNLYTPQVRPVPGLCEILKQSQKRSAFFYNWEELRDLARPGSLDISRFYAGHTYGYEVANRKIAEEAVHDLKQDLVDFAFLYFGWSDEAGHNYGWMSNEYLRALQESWKLIENIRNALSDDYLIIVTSDHGGHGRCHGTSCAEDMTIPLFFCGDPFEIGKELKGNINIKDIAPTIAKIFNVKVPEEWEGNSLI